ncbi:nitrite reductase [NAD(P)H] [Arthrobacter sp. Hiyo8]|nr:nitrite reductase [NAD(P)H] [Arthrobacter sp. Hiyo8]
MHTRGLEGWHVTVLTEEAHLPYDRVTLSKALIEVDYDLTLGHASMWDHEALDLRTGERVVKINPEAKSVETAAGNSYEYDALVVATGSNAARLPIPGAEHTHVYRTLEDVWAINKAITELTAKLGRRIKAVTIGGGLLGLESAAGTERLGATPIVIDGAPWLMATQLDEGAGQAMGRLIKDKGFEIHGGVFPSEVLSDDGQVTGVLMADGRIIDADIVIVAIGVRPATSSSVQRRVRSRSLRLALAAVLSFPMVAKPRSPASSPLVKSRTSAGCAWGSWLRRTPWLRSWPTGCTAAKRRSPASTPPPSSSSPAWTWPASAMRLPRPSTPWRSCTPTPHAASTRRSSPLTMPRPSSAGSSSATPPRT